MARSIYVMPRVVVAGKYGPSLLPKYLSIVESYGTRSRFDYGDEPWTMVAMDAVSPADNTSLIGNPDVFRLPDNLESTMGSTGNRNVARNALETVNMPGTWIQTTDTYRTVVRFVGALCQYMMAYTGHHGAPTLFTGGVSLSSTYGALGQPQRDALIGSAQYFGLSTSTLTTANTLRTMLKALGDDYVAQYLVGQNPLTKLDLVGPL